MSSYLCDNGRDHLHDFLQRWREGNLVRALRRLSILPQHQLQLYPGQPPPVPEQTDEGVHAAHEQVAQLDGQHDGRALVESQLPLAPQTGRGLQGVEDGQDLVQPRVHQRLLRLLALADEVAAEGVEIDGLAAVAVEVGQGDGIQVVFAQTEGLSESRMQQVQVAEYPTSVALEIFVPRCTLIFAVTVRT